MEKIKSLLEKRGEIENIGKSLSVLLNSSLDVLQKVAINHDPGEELHKAIKDYDLIYETSKNFLSEEELRRIKKRHGEIQERWAPGHYKK